MFLMTCHDSSSLNVLARGANMGSIGVTFTDGTPQRMPCIDGNVHQAGNCCVVGLTPHPPHQECGWRGGAGYLQALAMKQLRLGLRPIHARKGGHDNGHAVLHTHAAQRPGLFAVVLAPTVPKRP